MNAVQSSVSVLIPAHNEEASLADTIASIGKHRALFSEMEIIVINDGSQDRTGDIARALPVTLIEHKTTRGYGASLKDGLRIAKGDFVDARYRRKALPSFISSGKSIPTSTG